MPLSFLTGADEELNGFKNIQGVFPAVKRENIVLISLRDIDTKEEALLKANGITYFTAEDVRRHRINEVLKRAKAIAGNNTPGYNVSFDIDVVEGAFVPGTGTSVSFNPGEFATGMAPHNARYAVASLLQDGRALAVEVTELNPNLDRQNKTADFALSILKMVGKNWK